MRSHVLRGLPASWRSPEPRGSAPASRARLRATGARRPGDGNRGAPAVGDDAQRGEVNILVAGLVPALIIAIGLVVDGGGRLQAADHAQYAAEQAARAGAQEQDISEAQYGRPPTLNASAAVAAAESNLTAAGVSGQVDYVQGASIGVSATVTYRTKFLALIGIRSLSAEGSAEARAVRGITQEGS
ncbi:pilus assembly protein TadG-related protein [Myceligenerans xiligouense]|uniref:Putative Flp pilus-assembly TadE/G-like protein n=1 Tax=Myceligenerans xiligouense TaxID=253184 RepID=A0A3N4YJB1_9MICO|nr:pilus assembly protein TadG-related protein [Myceligenerans xiligouense]RPF19496.1 putative Flp pilus-assembly TadE/G-like protein [Myceligenerans xiligouense]